MSKPISLSRKRTAVLAAAFGAAIAAMTFAFFPALVSAQTAKTSGDKPLYPCFSRKACISEIDQGGAGGDFEEVAACGTGKGFCYALPKVYNPDTKKMETKEIPLIINIGGRQSVVNLSDYIATVYNYGIGIAVIVAAVMMMIGGLRYLTAGGDAGKVSQGKENIQNALLGLMLAFGAWLILNTINPDTVNLRLPRLPMAQKQEFALCNTFDPEVKCGDRFEMEPKEGAAPDAPDSQKFTVTASESGTCTGKSCKKAGVEGNARCREKSSLKPDQQSMIVKEIGDWVCATCKVDGAACDPDGVNDDCCTGFCGSGKCTTGENGAECNNTGTSCKSGLCQTRFGNSCSNGSVGAPCDDDTECRGGNVCIERTGFFICAPPQESGPCNDDQDCGGMKCESPALGSNYCNPFYAYNDTCPSGMYLVDDFGPNKCTTGKAGAICDDQQDCSAGFFCITEAATGSGGICGDGAPGSRCDDDSTCKPQAGNKGHCVNHNGDYETCTSGAEWSPCDSNDDCLKNKCNTTLKRCEAP